MILHREETQQQIAEYLRYLSHIRGLSGATIKAYEGDLQRFLHWAFASSAKQQLDHDLVRDFVAHMGRNALAAVSVNRAMSALRGFLRFMQRTGRISDSPAANIRSMKRGRRLPQFLFVQEMAQLLAIKGDGFADYRDRLICELLYSTGCRVSELVSIGLSDIDFKRRSVVVVGKGRKGRMVFIGVPALQALQAYLPPRELLLQQRHNSGEQALLVNQRGRRLSSRGVALIVEQRARQQALTKRISPHLFRHSFATHVLDGGANIRVVQEMLGHTNVSTTQVYTHLSIDRLRDVYNNAHPHSRARQGEKQS